MQIPDLYTMIFLKEAIEKSMLFVHSSLILRTKQKSGKGNNSWNNRL